MATRSLQSDGSRDAGVVDCARQREFTFQPRARLRSGKRRIGDFDDNGGPVAKTRCAVHREMGPSMQRLTYSEPGQFDHVSRPGGPSDFDARIETIRVKIAVGDVEPRVACVDFLSYQV
jgi:hypothetical protein